MDHIFDSELANILKGVIVIYMIQYDYTHFLNEKRITICKTSLNLLGSKASHWPNKKIQCIIQCILQDLSMGP